VSRIGAPRVLLLSMPWAKLAEPSLGLAILQAVLMREDIESRVRHFGIELLRYVKASSYTAIADINALNEFLFTQSLERDISAKQLIALSHVADGLMAKPSELSTRAQTRAEFIDYFLTIRNRAVPGYLDECVSFVKAHQPTLVGFTCMYDQTFASLALATRLKAQMPDLMIAFGGYALEGSAGLELLKCFDCVDVVAFGDGEPVIAGLARASVGTAKLEDIPNLAWRESGVIRQSPRERIDMGDSPEPNFTDFFRDLDEFERKDAVRIVANVIPLETSRGCWWGQKHHCTFCGIDEQTLQYRQRPAAQVLDMISSVSAKYPGRTLRLVDYILPHSYFATVLPQLATRQPGGPRLTCEVKSNLSAVRFDLLRDAGFIEIQPGIESFSSAVLQRMRKGVTGIQNVLTLKLGKARGIKIDWNILYGFPDDQLDDYEQLIQIIPHLYHLDPPFSCGDVLVTRFAPLHTEPQRFGLGTPKKHRIYDVLLSDEFSVRRKLQLENLCYFFDSPWRPSTALQSLHTVIDGQVDHWKEAARAHKGHRLSHRTDGDIIEFVDRRMLREQPQIRFYPAEVMQLYAPIHESVMNVRDLISGARSLSTARAQDMLESMLADRLVFREGDRVVGLSMGEVPAQEGRFIQPIESLMTRVEPAWQSVVVVSKRDIQPS